MSRDRRPGHCGARYRRPDVAPRLGRRGQRPERRASSAAFARAVVQQVPHRTAEPGQQRRDRARAGLCLRSDPPGPCAVWRRPARRNWRDDPRRSQRRKRRSCRSAASRRAKPWATTPASPRRATCGWRSSRSAMPTVSCAAGRVRACSQRRTARALPSLGRVSMDMVGIDLSAAPHLREGRLARSADTHLPRAAELSGLSQYELLTLAGLRLRRG